MKTDTDYIYELQEGVAIQEVENVATKHILHRRIKEQRRIRDEMVNNGLSMLEANERLNKIFVEAFNVYR